MNNYERYLDGIDYNLDSTFSEAEAFYKKKNAMLTVETDEEPNKLYITKLHELLSDWEDNMNRTLNKLIVKQFPNISLDVAKHPLSRGVIINPVMIYEYENEKCILPDNSGIIIELKYESMDALKKVYETNYMKEKIKQSQIAKNIKFGEVDEEDEKVDNFRLLLFNILSDNIDIKPFSSGIVFDSSYFYILVSEKYIIFDSEKVRELVGQFA